jgi:hypothetical protein
MGGKITAEIKLMGGGIQSGQTRQQLYTGMGIIICCGNEVYPEPVRFGLDIL